MDRRGAFQGGFGSGSIGSFDSHTSVDHTERWSSSTRSQCGGPRRIGSGLRRITLDWDKPWIPVTKLGRLVMDGRVATIDEIYLKREEELQEYQIVDLLVPNLKEQILKILPVQKHVRSGLRTRFRAFVAIGDRNGHVGLGMQCAKRVSTAIRRAIYRAKTAVVPVRRAYWHTKHGLPHTIPCKIMVRYCDVRVTLYPAPRGTGISALPIVQKLLHLGGIQDCYTSVSTYTTLGPVAKAIFLAIQRAYLFKREGEKIDEDNAFPELISSVIS
uniref:Small ribosomal subunit protein uS5 n=1 Tax=Elaeophora elaphi TaxID=1147741 RepID=A0A0R3RQW8_9BILA